MINTALLIIDMQNDFTENGAILEIESIRKNNNIDKFRYFIDRCREKEI